MWLVTRMILDIFRLYRSLSIMQGVGGQRQGEGAGIKSDEI